MNGTKLKSLERVNKELDRLLEEIRIVLPGTGVLLGFQFTAIFSQGFTKLPDLFQKLHALSLIFLIITVILLIAPVAFDRVVEEKAETKRFYDFAHQTVTWALVSLALGLSIDVFIVLHVIFISDIVASIISGALFLMCIFLWFGYTNYIRKKIRK